MMLGAVIKNYFAKKLAGVDPADVVSCSVMPCVRKQGEADRAWFATESAHAAADDCTCGMARDVDHVITTAELGKVLQDRGINLQVRGGSVCSAAFGVSGGGAAARGGRARGLKPWTWLVPRRAASTASRPSTTERQELPETAYDNPLGAGSGGGLLFGTTGGVMEAALRTVGPGGCGFCPAHRRNEQTDHLQHEYTQRETVTKTTLT
jgi:iron only hydrogenase large subunit-like protein